MAILVGGSCSSCGQCCGAESAPNPTSPWPATWPDGVRNWAIDDILSRLPIFKVTGHPAMQGPLYGSFKISTGQYYWTWVPGHGLCKNAPPWADNTSYRPECPVLMDEDTPGVYPCGIQDITINMPGGPVEGNDIREKQGCRELGMVGKTIRDEDWNSWITDHPACTLTGTVV